MAVLTLAQCIERIKTPKNGREILKARLKRQRHRLHTEPETECDNEFVFSPPHIRFLEWVKRILKSDDNFDRFRELYRPPVPTNELVESIFSQFEKVFESENKYEKFNFVDSDLEVDAAAYRKAIGDFTFWETQGFETFKNSIDNVLIVDLPRLSAEGQVSDYPQPYYYFLDIDNLWDIENIRVKAVDYGKEMAYFFRTEYVIFWDSPTTICVFDEATFRTFSYESGKEPTLISEVPHDLGYCPARSFWTTPLNSKSTFLKRSPITGSLSKLDWLLFQEIAAEYLKMYASYPIYAVYKGICNYKDPVNKSRCVDGWLLDENAPRGEKSNTRCPKCTNKMKVGPGNILELKAPQDKDDPDLLSNPVKIFPADEVSVKVVNEEIDGLWDCIFDSCVGGGLEVDDSQAKNEDQISAGFEGKTNKLLWIKKNFEIIHSFAMDTVFRLRYGDKYISGTIDYGDVFFQKDETVEMTEYSEAKTQGLPAFDLAIRRDKINETRYRNNPDMVERLRILANLDPFPDDSQTTILATYEAMPEAVDPIDLCIKFNFNRFIAKFEREQAPLLMFGSALTFDKKIAVIGDILAGYAKDYLLMTKTNSDLFTPAPPPPPMPPPGPPVPAPFA